METIAKTYYFHGDLAEYTGVSKVMHGALFFEYRLVEGHRKGECVWTRNEILSLKKSSGIRTPQIK